jgi:hypothetical protein
MNKRVVAFVGITILICGISFGLFKLRLSLVQSAQQEATPESEFLGETSDRDILEGNTETVIPQSASDIHGLVDGFQEITTYMRFTIPASDLDRFLSSTSCTTPLQIDASHRDFEIRYEKDWWQVKQAEVVGWCDGVKEHIAQSIYVDMTDLNKYIIYVVASTK